jgi:fluoroquinolone transport system permease protein
MLLLVIGGSTLMYVGGVILFEKSEGTLGATVVTPLRNFEYLVSKVASLSLLAAVEATVLVICAQLFVSGRDADLPDLGVFLLGVLSMGVIYTLIGVILVVRYESVTEFLVPILFVAVLLQAPAIHFSGLWDHSLLLYIPTAPPTLILKGAWEPLSPAEWLFAGGYTLITAGVLYVWSHRAFHKHIIQGIAA